MNDEKFICSMKNLHDTKKFIHMIINYTLDEIIIHQIKYLYIQMKNLYSQIKNLYIIMAVKI